MSPRVEGCSGVGASGLGVGYPGFGPVVSEGHNKGFAGVPSGVGGFLPGVGGLPSGMGTSSLGASGFGLGPGGFPGGVQGSGQVGFRPEEPAKYISELPRLAQTDLANSAVACGNWIAQIRQVLIGLSPSAGLWWQGVEGAATSAYQRWLVADPLGRLGIDPSTVKGEFDEGLFGRVESRAVSLLLAAVPQSVRDDVVTNRWLSSTSILFRVMCLFQPGGSTERAHLLSQLVNPDACRTFAEALKILRKWQQSLQRAAEIKAALPDASLLLRGVDTTTSGLLTANPMIGFRGKRVSASIGDRLQPHGVCCSAAGKVNLGRKRSGVIDHGRESG